MPKRLPDGGGSPLQRAFRPQHTIGFASGTQVGSAPPRALPPGSAKAPPPKAALTSYMAAKSRRRQMCARAKKKTCARRRPPTQARKTSGRDSAGQHGFTSDPSGLETTHTMLYEAATGNVIETRMPASAGAQEAHTTHRPSTTRQRPTANTQGAEATQKWAGLAYPQPRPAHNGKAYFPPLAHSDPTSTTSGTSQKNREHERHSNTYDDHDAPDGAGHCPLSSETTATAGLAYQRRQTNTTPKAER